MPPPSNLAFDTPSSRRAATDLSVRNTPLQTAVGKAPWAGFTPDLDVYQLQPNACTVIENLIPRSDDGGRGEVLTQLPGFDHVDSTYDATGTGQLGDAANSSNHITGMGFFPRVNAAGVQTVAGEFNDTLLAVVSGDSTTQGSSQFYRIVPTTGLWEEITNSALGGTVSLTADYPQGIVGEDQQLIDFANFPVGSAQRTGLTALTANEPVHVFTNNLDPVMIYAIPSGGSAENGDYEVLTHALGTGANAFKARSVEAWGDRMNYFNTEESGVRHPQRLRRTAIGDVDPDPALDGSGATDFEDFAGNGLRVESLGDVLACYFEDGVAFVRRSGQSIAPYQIQTITKDRGLLSTHSLVNLGGGVHFGLFTDGWFFLDSNGQFSEAGVSQLENTRVNKWRETFYRRLSFDLRARIDMQYSPRNRWVYITVPFDNTGENETVWVYDIQGDRIFTSPQPVTKYGTANAQIQTAELIDDDDVPIDDSIGTIDSTGAKFGLSSLVHGTNNGLAVIHKDTLTSQININTSASVEPSFVYTTIFTSVASPHRMKTLRRVLLEYVKVSERDPTITVFGNPSQTSQSVVLSTLAPQTGAVSILKAGFRFSSAEFGVTISGPGPFKIRTFHVEFLDYGVEFRL